MRKSNPVLLEWLHSPICYRGNDGFLNGMRKLPLDCYSPVACFHHYLLARKQAAGELGIGPAIPAIDVFLAAELPRLAQKAASLPTVPTINPDALDDMFRAWVLTQT